MAAAAGLPLLRLLLLQGSLLLDAGADLLLKPAHLLLELTDEIYHTLGRRTKNRAAEERRGEEVRERRKRGEEQRVEERRRRGGSGIDSFVNLFVD